jgi:hypothetical protein
VVEFAGAAPGVAGTGVVFAGVAGTGAELAGAELAEVELAGVTGSGSPKKPKVNVCKKPPPLVFLLFVLIFDFIIIQ